MSPRFKNFLLSTALHVLLEGFSLGDGLTGILVLLGGGVLGVGLSSHGPSHLKSLGIGLGGWVGVYVEGRSGLEGRGRGESGGRADKSESENLLLG